jgi:hypothetical protein
MTPQEKAFQLIDSFDEYAESRISDNGRGFDKRYCSKQCALIAVDEIINETSTLELHPLGTYTNPKIEYWQQVKKEIELT